MNPTNKDVYTFNSKSLDSAIVSNSWGLFGKRMVTVVDQNNNSQTLKFDYLIKLADEKIVNAKVKGDKEELRDAYEFLDRVIILNKNSKKLTSYFDYSKEGDIEKIQLTNSDKRQEIYQEVSENAKANLLNMIGIDTSEHSDSSLSFVVNMSIVHFPKFKAELDNLFKSFKGNIAINLIAKDFNGMHAIQKLPENDAFVKILEHHGNNIQFINLPEYSFIDEKLANKIADYCPNLLVLPLAFGNLEPNLLYKLIQKFTMLKALPENTKDLLIAKINQYKLKNEAKELDKLNQFVSENLHIIKLSSQIDATDTSNSFRRQKIATFARDIRETFKGNTKAEKIADEIDFYGTASFFDNSDISKNIYSHLMNSGYYDKKNDIQVLKDLESLKSVSKSFQKSINEVIDETINEWGKEIPVPLGRLGLRTADEAVAFIIKYHLTEVDLSMFSDLSKNHLQQLADLNIHTLYLGKKIEDCPEMKSVKMLIADEKISYSKFPNLERTHVSFDNGKNLSKLLTSCMHLNTIQLSLLREKDKDFSFLEDVKSNLINVNFNFTKLTDEALVMFGKACPKLKTIGFHFCTITQDGLEGLIKTCPNLQNIYLIGMTDEVPNLEEFKKTYPNIKFSTD